MRPTHAHLCALLAAALLAGCPNLDPNSASTAVNSGAAGKSANSASSQNCSPLDGVYRLTYVKRGGSCGDQPEELVQFNDGASAPIATQSCQAGGEEMSTPCAWQRDSMCSVSDPLTGTFLGMVHVTGTLTEVNDNTTAKGSFNVTTSDTTGVSCQGTYDVTAVKVR